MNFLDFILFFMLLQFSAISILSFRFHLQFQCAIALHFYNFLHVKFLQFKISYTFKSLAFTLVQIYFLSFIFTQFYISLVYISPNLQFFIFYFN